MIGLFTLEGSAHGILAGCLRPPTGSPCSGTLARHGWELPPTTESYGFAIGERLFPVFTVGLVMREPPSSFCIVTTVVSFIPVRRIARLKPTDALRGKFS